MGFFRSTNGTGPYFEGWYLKHQTLRGQTLALIPAFHIDSGGRRTASLQVISNDRSWWLEYPEEQLQASRQPFQVQIGQSSFGSQGIGLHIRQDGLSLCGTLRYGPFTVLRSDIMGPFRFFAGMQCSHGIISMGHSLRAPGFLRRDRIYRDRPGTLLSQRVPLDAMRLEGGGARQPDACCGDDPPACGGLHRLHLFCFLRRPRIPPGHLPGRQN